MQIVFHGAAPTTSDETGHFRLVFVNKELGDVVFRDEIIKKGYELVNEKELEYVQTTMTSLFSPDIILAKNGVIDAAKKEYYNISTKNLDSNFENQKKILNQKRDNKQLSNKQYQEQYNTLLNQYENQKKVCINLSEKFAEMNLDDVSTLQKEALQLFKDEKIDEAIKKLEVRIKN